MSCRVKGCKSRIKSRAEGPNNVSFHYFPKNHDIRLQWLAAIGAKEDHHKKFWRLCSRHFKPEYFIQNSPLRIYLQEDAVPTLNLSVTIKVEDDLIAEIEHNIAKEHSYCSSNTLLQQEPTTGPQFRSTDPLMIDTENEHSYCSSDVSVKQEPTTNSQTTCLQARPPDNTKMDMAMKHKSTDISSSSLKPIEQLRRDMGSVEKTMLARQDTTIAVQQGRIEKLEKELKQSKLISKGRLLKLNSIKQKNLRLRKKCSKLLELIKLLQDE